MKESRNRRTGPKRAPALETKRPLSQKALHPEPKRLDPQPDLELLAAIKAWAGAQAGESATDEALSSAERPGRFRLKGALDRFFRHYARLSWLIQRQKLPVTPEWLWGAAAVILDRIEPEPAAKAIAVTTADIRVLSPSLARIRADGLDHPDMPPEVALECPPALFPILSASFGPRLKQELTALNMSAPLDIRANTLKINQDALLRQLATAGVETRPVPYAQHGLRAKGRPDLAKTEAFLAGLFDMQDEGSQLVAALAGAEPGQQVLDFCAGAGGKSLALAAAMQNKGHLVAADVSARRLARAKLRFKRAGAENAERVQLTGKDEDPFFKRRANWFDRVVVDAPCSGVGAWRRHPETKWKQDHGVARLTSLQDSILARAAKLVKRGGRLVYATCSLLPDENEARAGAFLRAHPNFKPIHADTLWPAISAAPWPCAQPKYLKLTPAQHGTDGFFAAVFERVS
jgi:16S rRNA (cytosine967-C5)-methyltransferase